MTLAAAQRALDAGDDAAALVALVEAWQANRHPRIADLIDRLSARVVGPRPTVIPTDAQVAELDRVFESLADA